MTRLAAAGGLAVSARSLLERLRSFSMPDPAAAEIIAISNTQHGTICSAPGARELSFTAQETIRATTSEFRWEARVAGKRLLTVTDEYVDGRGSLTFRVAGLRVRRSAGPHFDRGELQRYLALVALCPSMIVNNRDLHFSAIGRDILRLEDARDVTGAFIDVELRDDGAPVACRGLRPMEAGRSMKLTPWSATPSEFVEQDGLRVPTKLSAAWHLALGPFTYVSVALDSFSVARRENAPAR